MSSVTRSPWMRMALVVLLSCAGAASAQQIIDTFARPDGTGIGATEQPAPGIPYVERSTTGPLVDVAAIAGGELFVYGTEGSGPTTTGPGQAIIELDAADLDISADMRFSIVDPAPGCTNNSAGFILRKPNSEGHIGQASSGGQILIQMTPAGGLYIGQKDLTGGNISSLYGDKPWMDGQQGLGDLNVFSGPGTLPTSLNGQPFDVDGDGVLEATEPFRFEARLHGTSLEIYVNGQVTASIAVSGTGSTPHNYFAPWVNRWTGSAACAPSHVYFDNLQATVAIPNDTCANAIELPGGTVSGLTAGATQDGSATCGSAGDGPDIWYSYTAKYSSNLMVDTCGSGFDTVVSVLDGCGGTELGCNQDCPASGACAAPASCLSVPVQAGQKYLIRAAGTNGASGLLRLTVQEDVAIRHVGQNSPAGEGWTLNTNAALYTIAPGTDGEDHWIMQLNPGSFIYYSRALAASQVNSATGWTATWRTKLVASADIWQAVAIVEDGQDAWGLHLIDGTGSLPKGVYVLASDASTPVRLSDLDPTGGFHSYQIVFDPASQTAFYYIDGTLVGWQTRGDAANVPRLRMIVGDGSSGGPASHQLWSYGELVLRQQPLAPPNDLCATAAALTDGVTRGSTAGASTDGAASCGNSNASPDVWYTYTATCSGDLTLDTCGSLMNTVLSVYTGSCGAGAEVACSDDCAGLPCTGPGSCVKLAVSPGETYLIRVAGANGDRGAFRLQARCGIPLNDNCTDAIAVEKGSVEGSTLGASADGTASCGNSNSSPDVWYTYTPTSDGILRIDTCGSTLNTVVSVYDQCGGTELACNDDCAGPACTGSESCLAVTVQAGVTYRIRVAGVDGAQGNFKLTLRDNVVIQHVGRNNPTTQENWVLTAAGGVVGEPGSEGLDYWRIATNSNSRLAYRANLDSGQVAPADFNDPSGWTLTGTVRVIQARSAFSTLLYVMDGKDLWGLHAINRPDLGRQGVYRTPVDVVGLTEADRLASVDPTDGYHTYQIVYDPAGDGGIGAVSYYFDGTLIGTDVRANSFDISLYQIQWGDDTTGGEYGDAGPSDARYTFVQFELGQHVRPGPPIVNDGCATASVITEGEYYGVTGGAAAGGSASCGNSNASPDVWYSFVASCTGNMVADTCGSTLDSVVSIYSGCGGTELACNDDFCGQQSRAVAPVTAGNTYLIRVAGKDGAAGPFRLHVGCGVPVNDNCASAAVVGEGATPGTTLGATADGAAACGDSNASPDVWYTYTATCNAPVEVNTCGSTFDSVVSIYDMCGGTELACGDNECDQQSRAEVNATLGTTYLIRVSGNRQSQGKFTLNVLCKEPPVNDLCPNAITITDGVTSGSTLFATADGDASCGNSFGSRDVWYLYTASRSGRLKIDASEANFPAVISLHSPPGCPGNLENEYACGTTIVSKAVQKDVTYLVRVAGVNGAAGSFKLKVGYDNVVILHEGKNVPLEEGWTRDVNNLAFVEGPAEDSKPHWFMAQFDGARVNYQFTGLTTSDFADPEGWTMSAVFKAVTSLGDWQVHIMLQDGVDTWVIHLIDGTGAYPRGVYTTVADFDLVKISDIDPTADYHLYQMAYDPLTDSVNYIIDGVGVYTHSRADSFDAGGYQRLVWGDNSSGGGPSHGKYALVQFQFGSQAGACRDPFADADGDGDVDQEDFGQFQLCYTGTDGGVNGNCACFDLDGNDNVDLADLQEFIKCAATSGPMIPVDKGCDN